MLVNIYDAKTNLSALLDRAVAGEEIVIARAGKPLARLMPVTAVASKSGVRLGGLKRPRSSLHRIFTPRCQMTICLADETAARYALPDLGAG